MNVLGCLVAGLLVGLVERQEMFSPDTRLLLFTGLLGGFITFSAFGVETMFLLRRELWVALGYVLASVICGIALQWFGMAVIPYSKFN